MPSGMTPEIEAMRPKKRGKEIVGKGPRRPKHRDKLERKHRIKKFTTRLKRQRRA